MTNHRRGVSLAELLIVMSACTLVLTLSTALIHRILRVQSNARSFEQRERSALRLSSYFRQDVHDAQDAILDPASATNGVFLRLQTSKDQSVEYQVDEYAIVRRSFKEEALLSQEAFDFGTDIQIAIREDESPRALTLSVSEQPVRTMEENAVGKSVAYARPVAFQVTAVVGRLSQYPVVAEEDAR